MINHTAFWVVTASLLAAGCSSSERVSDLSDLADLAETADTADLADSSLPAHGDLATHPDLVRAPDAGPDLASGPDLAGAPLPAGWLYTSGNKIYRSDGAGGGSVWVGRGVNLDDLFLCGYNAGLGTSNAKQILLDVIAALMADWKPSFVRVSLGMNSYTPVSWTSNPSQYRAPMIEIIEALGAHPNTYVLVTLRSDTSMVTTDGDPCGQGDDAVCLPSDDTDAVYRALVDSFKDAPYVVFGVANEPGGQSASEATLRARMTHAVGVIRAEEDLLGVPHHLVAVQGNNWTSRIGFYNSSPIAADNVIYEYHSYPPEATGTYGYTQSNLPVIIGEYGPGGGDADLPDADAFYADVEAKQIPTLAWDLSPYSNCAPDLVQVTHSTTLTPNAWGMTVRAYLLAHAN